MPHTHNAARSAPHRARIHTTARRRRPTSVGMVSAQWLNRACWLQLPADARRGDGVCATAAGRCHRLPQAPGRCAHRLHVHPARRSQAQAQARPLLYYPHPAGDRGEMHADPARRTNAPARAAIPATCCRATMRAPAHAMAGAAARAARPAREARGAGCCLCRAAACGLRSQRRRATWPPSSSRMHAGLPSAPPSAAAGMRARTRAHTRATWTQRSGRSPPNRPPPRIIDAAGPAAGRLPLRAHTLLRPCAAEPKRTAQAPICAATRSACAGGAGRPNQRCLRAFGSETNVYGGRNGDAEEGRALLATLGAEGLLRRLCSTCSSQHLQLHITKERPEPPSPRQMWPSPSGHGAGPLGSDAPVGRSGA